MPKMKRSAADFGLVRTLNLLAFAPIAVRAPLYGRLLWALATDARVPTSRKVLLAAAAVYVLSPVDLIPRRVPVLGALDDVVVVIVAVDAFLDGLPAELIGEKLDELGIPRTELDADRQRVRRLVPRPLRRLVARVPDAIDGVAAAARDAGLERRLRELLQTARTEEIPA